MDRKDKQGIKANVHIVLKGPDGQIKDERTPDNLHKKEEETCEKNSE